MLRTLRAALVAALLALALAGTAQAAGGNVAFDGGTQQERQQVRSALAASSFDWSLVQAQVTVHIQRGISESEAVPGQIWLDADLLDAGSFSWAIVQHEYAHQIDFFLLDETARATLRSALGGKAWCWETPGVSHEENGCERFASLVAWAYWPAQENSLRPDSAGDEAGHMQPAQFRALMGRLLAGKPRTTASVKRIVATAPAPAAASGAA